MASLWGRATRMVATEELLKKALLVQKRFLDYRNRCWVQRAKEVVLEAAYGASIGGAW